jgi:hypothetical protein
MCNVQDLDRFVDLFDFADHIVGLVLLVVIRVKSEIKLIYFEIFIPWLAVVNCVVAAFVFIVDYCVNDVYFDDIDLELSTLDDF